MFDVYELYGSQGSNLQEVRALLSSLELTFEDHESYYIGEYFFARGPLGQAIAIESNRLEDEDGAFDREDEFSEYGALIRLEYTTPAGIDDIPAVDELSGELRKTQGLILLQREFYAHG